MQPAGRFSQTVRSCIKRNGPFGYREYTNIYAIDAPEIGRIKFGMTIDVQKRFRGISNMSPAPLILLGSVWLPDVAEGYIFDFLKTDRCHGEWFHRSEAVRSVAAFIAAKSIEHLAEVIGMKFMLQESIPSGVAWGRT